MNAEQQLLRNLLQGDMICEFTNPSGHSRLSEHAYRERVSETIGQLGYELRSLGEQTVFYLIDSTEPSNAAIKSALEEVTTTSGVAFQLFATLIKIAGDDYVFTPGHVLEKDQLLTQLNSQEAVKKGLEVAVQSFSKSTQALSSNAALLDKAFDQLEKLGYLRLEDRDRERYRVTGKVCYLQLVLDYITDSEMIDIEEPMTLLDQQNDLAL